MYQRERNETEKIYTIKSLENEFEKQYKKYKTNNNIYINTKISTPRKYDNKKKSTRKNSLKKTNKTNNILSFNENNNKNKKKPKLKLKLKRPQSFIEKNGNEANNKNTIYTEKNLDNNKILLKNSKSESDFTIRKKFEKFDKKLEIYSKYKELMENSKKIQENLKSENNLFKLTNILKIRKIQFNNLEFNHIEYFKNKKLKNNKIKTFAQQTIFPFRNIGLTKSHQSNYNINFINIYNSINSYRRRSKIMSRTDRTVKCKNRMSFNLGKNNKNLEMKESEFYLNSNTIECKKRIKRNES